MRSILLGGGRAALVSVILAIVTGAEAPGSGDVAIQKRAAVASGFAAAGFFTLLGAQSQLVLLCSLLYDLRSSALLAPALYDVMIGVTGFAIVALVFYGNLSISVPATVSGMAEGTNVRPPLTAKLL